MTINRGVSKNSQYVFNAETGMLEYIEENAQTIESLSKLKDDKTKNLDDIGKEVNALDKQEPINNITVITADDNLIHNYFTSMDVSWDSLNCLSSAIIKAPKMNTTNTNYWTTYTGQLTIYAGYNFTFDYVNSNSHNTEADAANSLTKYWDNSNILPFFRGEISRIKETEQDIIIYVDSIGVRFHQKIPDEFRQAFINNQNVRDAFQAICEFLGVKYICPPKTTSENEEEETEDPNAITDGTENDVNSQEAKTKDIQNKAKKKVKKAVKKPKSSKKKSKKKSNQSNKSTGSSNTNQSSTPTNGQSVTLPNGETATEDGTQNQNEDDLTNNEEIDTPQNGYDDISFDASGAIVHGSKAIETSPDMAETLLAMEENPLDKYLEDESGIVESVLKLLEGEMFDELHNKVMDYDAITIEPKAASTSDMSATGANAAANTNTNNQNNNQNNNENNNSGGGSSSSGPQKLNNLQSGSSLIGR